MKATAKSKCGKLLRKRELQYITKRIRDIDTSIYTAHIEKLMDEKESIQLSTFSQRNHLWKHWKACGKLSTLLQFLAEGFCDLMLKHVKGKERFARFFVCLA